MRSQLMFDGKQSDTRKFAAGMVHARANLLAAPSARSNFQQPSAGLFSVFQIAGDLNLGSTSLPSGLFSVEQGPYPLRM